VLPEALAGCAKGLASIPARDRGSDLGAVPAAGAGRADSDLRVATTRVDPLAAPVPLVCGKAMRAANRHHTTEENARYQFACGEADFGACGLDGAVAKPRAFVDQPPNGLLSLTRANDDQLLYDPKSNVVAVVRRDSAPRTIFKPREGASCWQEQKDRQAEYAAGGDRQGGSPHYRNRGSGRQSADGADDQG
jgi:pyocin large subunit-like protein